MQSVLFSAAPITSVDIENTRIKRITIKKQYNSFKCNIDVAKTVSDTIIHMDNVLLWTT